jgi:uncharacterized protein with FMN-binding domain
MSKTPASRYARYTRTTRQPDLTQTLKKVVLSGFVVLSFVAYAIHDRLTGSNSTASNQDNLVPQPASGNSKGSNGTSSSSTVANQVTPVPTNTPQGAYRDGQYTGPVTDAFYGNVQVQAIIQGGKITDVKWLDFPHDRRTSQEINQQATPWLTQETIQAQSAQVDFISGATLTSQAFVQSLQAALSQAAN